MSSDLPAAWSTVPLSTIAHVYSGGTPLRAVPAYWGGSIPWVTTSEIDGGDITQASESITRAGLDSSAAKVAPEGTLLLAMYGQGKTRGKVGMLRIPAAMNQACAAIEPGSKVDRRYLLHYLRSRYSEIRSMSNAGSQENLSGDLVKRIGVVLPPIHEQRAIADSLDDIDQLIETIERSIVKRRTMRQGLMQQLLTGRTRLSGFSGEWRDVTLGDHVSYVKTVALSRAQLDSESAVRYLHYGDIHTRSDVRLDAAREAMPRASSTLLQNAGRLQDGDLVFADASEDADGVGKSVEVTSVPDSGVVAGLHTIAARFDKRVLADGFKGYLQFTPSFREALLRLAAGTKVLATTRSFISSITVVLPDIDEQRAVATVLSDADAEIQQLQDRLAKTRNLRQGMMQELLTGRAHLSVEEGAA